MANVSLRHVYKIYDGGVTAVTDFNLEIADKELSFSLVLQVAVNQQLSE
jgi:ABC-type sugar transport systems, ATPase components